MGRLAHSARFRSTRRCSRRNACIVARDYRSSPEEGSERSQGRAQETRYREIALEETPCRRVRGSCSRGRIRL
jgi:hypothetical protein